MYVWVKGHLSALQLLDLVLLLHSRFPVLREVTRSCVSGASVCSHTLSLNDGASVLSLTSIIIRCSGCDTLQSVWVRPSTAAFSAFLVPPAATTSVFLSWINVSLQSWKKKNIFFARVLIDVCGAWHYGLIKLHAGDVWRVIGYCTHIKDSQVQASSIMIIIIHVSQKISYLTEVIHTPLDWLLLLF